MVNGLWLLVEPYAQRAAWHFFGRKEHDVEDVVQSAAVRCLEIHAENPSKTLEELALISKRAVWNLCIDELRKRRVHAKAVTDMGHHKKGAGDNRTPYRAVAAAEILALIREATAEQDVPILELAANQHSWAEMAAKTGRSTASVNHSLNRIHAHARRLEARS